MRPWDLRAFPSLPKTSAARILVTRDGRDRNVVTGWNGTKVRRVGLAVPARRNP